MPYVQSLLDDDRTYTEHERRWLKTVGRIDYQSNVDDYLQHWRDDWGGTTTYAQYPNPPIMVEYRHKQGANVLFYDGHVTWMDKRDIFTQDEQFNTKLWNILPGF